MYVDDCVEGITRIMESDYSFPLNLGTDELVTIDELVDIVAEIAGKRIVKHHDTSCPQGVRGRNSDNSRLRRTLGWEPKITLRQGCMPTYRWISESLARAASGASKQAAD
jgi:nucleoside-diphosphate-sugar epimerase